MAWPCNATSEKHHATMCLFRLGKAYVRVQNSRDCRQEETERIGQRLRVVRLNEDADGGWQRRTDWRRIVSFGKQAEFTWTLTKGS